MATIRHRVRVLANWAGRAHGLLHTDRDAPAVVLVGCASVHTFGMHYPIDVAFISAAGEVLRVIRPLCPSRVACCWRARFVVERPHMAGPWLARGTLLACELVAVSQERGEADVKA